MSVSESKQTVNEQNKNTQNEVISNITESKETSNLTLINVKAGSINIKTLLDTGSSVSILDLETFKEIQKEKQIKVKIIQSNVHITTITGSKIQFQYLADFPIQIGNIKIKHSFFITQGYLTNYKMIIGCDLMKKHRASLHISKGLFTINECKVKLIGFDQRFEDDLSCTVSLNEKCILEPGQSKVINVITKTVFTQDQTIVTFEPNHTNKDIIIKPSINKLVKDKTSLLVSNISDKKVHLNKNMKVGNIHQAKNKQIDNQKVQNHEINLIQASEEILKLREQEFSLNNFNLQHLELEFKENLENLLTNYKQVFSSSIISLGHCDTIKPKMDFYHETPITCKPYPIPHHLKDVAREKINELVEAHIIKPTDTDWLVPAIMVKKKTEQGKPTEFRFVLDMRSTNRAIKLIPQNLPKLRDVLTSISGRKYYTTLDLANAFWQLDFQEYEDKMGFTTTIGNFAFQRMGYGMKNCSEFFQKLMNKVLEGLESMGILCFIDDIIIAANHPEEMLHKIRIVLERLKVNNLTLKPSKSQFMMQKIVYLGYEISENGITPTEQNTQKITSFERPKNVKTLKKYLGLITFYKTSIKNFAENTASLEKLLKKGTKFYWTDEQENAFQNLQKQFFTKPFLATPNFDQPFILNTDASKIAISAVLCQVRQGKLAPISYFSKKLNPAQAKQSAIILELTAIYEGILFFNDYLYGKKFTVLSDHRPLEHLDKIQSHSHQVKKMLNHISMFDFEVRYLPGNVNILPDFLSRLETGINNAEKNLVDFECDIDFAKKIATRESIQVDTDNNIAKKTVFRETPVTVSNKHVNAPNVNNNTNIKACTNSPTSRLGDRIQKDGAATVSQEQISTILVESGGLFPLGCELSEENIINEQKRDSKILSIKEKLLKGEIELKYKNYFLDNQGTLRFRRTIKKGSTLVEFENIVLPDSLRRQALENLHLTHLGGQKMFKLLREYYHFDNMRRDALNFALSCLKCCQLKRQHKKLWPHQIREIPAIVGMNLSCDILGPLQRDKYVLSLIDNYSRHMELFELNRIDTKSIIPCFIDYFARFGTPNTLLCDNATNFTSHVFKEIQSQLGVKILHSPSYTPSMNSLVESPNKQIKECILALGDEITDLSLILKLFKSNYNCSEHSSIGFSPNEIFFGRRVPSLNQKFKQLDNTGELMKYPVYMSNIIRRLNTWHKDAKKSMNNAQISQQNYTTSKSDKINLREGDYVTLRDQKGFKKQTYQGKFRIIKKIAETLFEIQNSQNQNDIRKAHISKLKRVEERLPHLIESPPIDGANTPTPMHDYNLRSKKKM